MECSRKLATFSISINFFFSTHGTYSYTILNVGVLLVLSRRKIISGKANGG